MRLASGEIATYYYAWRGGPRLVGKPGSPEFVQSYHDAHAEQKAKRKHVDSLMGLLDAYEDTGDFKALADATQRGYRQHPRAIAKEFGDFPVAALADRRLRGGLALVCRRGADYRFAVFARVLSWSYNCGLAPLNPLNPLERPGRLYRAARKGRVWTAEDEAAFFAKATRHMHLALMLALWTGQRQGDLLRLTWTAYDGEKLRISKSKDRCARAHSRRSAVEGRVGGCASGNEGRDYSDHREGAGLDAGRVSDVLGQGVCGGGGGRPHVSRSEGDGGHAVGDCWLLGARDRNDHRA